MRIAYILGSVAAAILLASYWLTDRHPTTDDVYYGGKAMAWPQHITTGTQDTIIGYGVPLSYHETGIVTCFKDGTYAVTGMSGSAPVPDQAAQWACSDKTGTQ